MRIQDHINKQNPHTPPRQTVSPQDAINRYGGMSEEQMMQELLKIGAVSTGGTSPKQLDTFFMQVQSFLSAEQKARMAELITQLKNS